MVINKFCYTFQKEDILFVKGRSLKIGHTLRILIFNHFHANIREKSKRLLILEISFVFVLSSKIQLYWYLSGDQLFECIIITLKAK